MITAAYVEGQVIHQLTVTVTFKIPVKIDALTEVLVVPGRRQLSTYIHNHMKRGHFTKDTRSTVLNTTDHESRIKDQGRHPEAYRRSCSDRPIIQPYDYDHYSANNYDNHSQNGQYTQQYIERYGSQNENRRNSGVDSIVHQMGPKN